MQTPSRPVWRQGTQPVYLAAVNYSSRNPPKSSRVQTPGFTLGVITAPHSHQCFTAADFSPGSGGAAVALVIWRPAVWFPASSTYMLKCPLSKLLIISCNFGKDSLYIWPNKVAVVKADEWVNKANTTSLNDKISFNQSTDRFTEDKYLSLKGRNFAWWLQIVHHMQAVISIWWRQQHLFVASAAAWPRTWFLQARHCEQILPISIAFVFPQAAIIESIHSVEMHSAICLNHEIY